MTILAAVLFISFTVLALGLAVYWTVVIWRVVYGLLTLPTGRAGARLASERSDWPSLRVLVPAHNEGETIAPLIRSLRAQDYPGLRVVLALDRCTDDTEAVARREISTDARFTIVPITQCLDGWAGKVSALHQAAQSTPHDPADLVLFSDADCRFAPGALAACVALLDHRRLDMLSLLTTLTTDRWFERLVQLPISLELVRMYPPTRANPKDTHRVPQRPFANGQFMLFRSAAYHQIGGHAAVREELLEDIAFARALARAGLRPGLLFADGLVRCRMYGSWNAFRSGWKRIFIESANRKTARLRTAASRLIFAHTLLPLSALIGLAAAITALALGHASTVARMPALVCLIASSVGVAAYAGALTLIGLRGRYPFAGLIGYPIGAALASFILRDAARDLARGTPVRWGGREYHRPAR